MKILTDASYKDGKSTHCFIIKDWNDKVMYSEKFNGLADTPLKAELHTIERALQFCQRKGFSNLKLYTDCKNLVDGINGQELKHTENVDVNYLTFLMKNTKTKIKWKPRVYVDVCDWNCKTVFKPRFNKRRLNIKKVR